MTLTRDSAVPPSAADWKIPATADVMSAKPKMATPPTMRRSVSDASATPTAP